MGYLSNFIVYMLAMVGVIMIALFVFKKTTSCNIRKTSGGRGLRVVETLPLSTRKTLYVIEAGKERFLIAGDIDRTTLISKLCSDNFNSELPEFPRENTRQEAGIYTTNKAPYESVIKNLAEKIRG